MPLAEETKEGSSGSNKVFLIDPDSHDLDEVLAYNAQRQPALHAGWACFENRQRWQTEIVLKTTIAAPLEKCFDLARSIDLHVQSACATRESAIGGVTAGLIANRQEVEWKAKHFGLWWRLRVAITAFDPPNFFQDRMIKGPFRSFIHDHLFEPSGSGTLMTDTVSFESPMPVLGWLFDRLVLSQYLRRFLQARNFVLKAKAEAQQWQNS